MGVNIDKAWRYQQTVCVDDPMGVGGRVFTNGDNLAGIDRYIGKPRRRATTVNNCAIFDQ